MFLSMTGFARVEHQFPWGTVTFEISSVNHRYQEITVRIPKELSALENGIVTALRAGLKRGKIKLSADIAWTAAAQASELNADVLCSYYVQLQEICVRLGIAETPNIERLLSLPGVYESPSLCDDSGEGSTEVWERLTEDAIRALLEMKASEGAKLGTVIQCDLNDFETICNNMSERWSEASKAALEGLQARIEKVMESCDLALDQNRVAQEVSIMADKWDVSEELARLASHIAKFREIAAGSRSEGRKLDFLIQEMNREINTMGSKVSDASFRWLVVEAKSCLERIREQIQNVE